LPSNAYAGRIDIPNPAGFSNYSTQEKGVNWTMTSNNKGIALNFSFYTIMIRYNAAGQLMGGVIPRDGRTIKVPYYYAVL